VGPEAVVVAKKEKAQHAAGLYINKATGKRRNYRQEEIEKIDPVRFRSAN
jgi:hypothetical protein